MSTYRKTWTCCGDTTETEAWEPTECPFCNAAPAQAPAHERLAELLHAIGWRASSDAQWTNLRDALPKIKELLAEAVPK